MARQPNAIHARARPRAGLQPLTRRSVSINGATFSALVRDGASADEIIERVAKENDGGVAKIYNAELKAYEIVAVKLGDHLLVKDDPAKVSKADFSQFKDQGSVKESAVRASHESKGGIHFFLGENGIPVAVGNEGELAFPNAEELRLRGDMNTIHISLVDYNANPVTLNDLDDMYSMTGGIRMSELAQKQMAQPFFLDRGEGFTSDEIRQAHGGMRSEKLLLVDTSVLILNKDTGDMVAMAENGIRPEGFRAPHFDAVPVTPVINQPQSRPFVEINRLQHADLGPMHIPMDGSAVKIPYLFIKVFDGNVGDAVSLTHPLEELKTSKEHQQIQLPAVMLKNEARGKEPKKGKDILHTEPEFTLRPVKTKRTPSENFGMPLSERIPATTSRQAPHQSTAKPKTARKSPGRLSVKKSLPLKKTAKKKRKKKARRLKPRPSAKKKTRKIPKAELIKKKRKKRKTAKITEPLAEKARGEKKDPRKKKRPKPKAMKAKKPSALKHEKTRKRKADKLRKTASKNKKRKRKKSYFLNEMLGLYKKRAKAGRTRARNSR